MTLALYIIYKEMNLEIEMEVGNFDKVDARKAAVPACGG